MATAQTEVECFERTGVNQTNIEDSLPGLRNTSIAVLFISLSIYFFSFLIFFTFRRKNSLLAKRSLTLLTCQTIGFMFITVNYCLAHIVGKVYNCHYFTLMGAVGAVLVLPAYFLRIFFFYWRITFSQRLIEIKFETLKEVGIDFSVTSRAHTDEADGECERNDRISLIHVKKLIFKIFCYRENSFVPKQLAFAFFLSCKRTIVKLYCLIVVLLLLLLLCVHFTLVLPFYLECYGCELDNGAESISLVLLFAIPTLYILFKLRHYPDSLGVKKEMYVFAGITVVLHLFFELLRFLFLFKAENEGKFDFGFFVILEYILVTLYSLPYQALYKKDREVECDTCPSLGTILKTEEGAKAFLIFLSFRLSAELLLFCKAVELWKESFERNTEEVMLDEARQLFENFLNDGSMFRINISWHSREKLMQDMENNFNVNIFDTCYMQTYYLMNGDLLHDFVKSSLYSALRNEVDDKEIVDLKRTSWLKKVASF